jgi:hypothetical protein
VTTREANLLSQVIRQQVQQIPIPLLIQQRLVDELGIRVALAALGDGEVEMQRWR